MCVPPPVPMIRFAPHSPHFNIPLKKAPAWSPLELHNHVQRIPDVGLNSTIGQVNSALENATGESCEGLLGRCRMNGRGASRMTRVEEPQEIERLTAAYLTKDDPVWAMAQG